MDSPGVDEKPKTVKPKVGRNKAKKNTPVSQLTREELEARFAQLEAHNRQLLNLLAKSQGATDETHKIQKGKDRPFDFSKHSKRHVLLKFAYLGWDYNGFAVQEDTQQTIEAHLFSALLRTRLIESRETSNYHRCGRTDKGVSAFDQVISITLRSNLKSSVGSIKSEDCETSSLGDCDDKEINYVILLNKVLPPEIRMLAWCPAVEGYSARFDCSNRTYKYFFPRGALDIKLMNEAAQHLIGYHDYRNFCKMDVGNGVVNFCRRIFAIDICEMSTDVQKTTCNSIVKETNINKLQIDSKEVDTDNCTEVTEGSSERTLASFFPSHGADTSLECESRPCLDGYDMCIATIKGQAFLWHQVRAIMSVLFIVGEGREDPSIIQELLNVEKHPRKPQYCLASDAPLNLYETTFNGVEWRWDKEVLQSVVSHFQSLWTQHSVRTTMIRRMLWDLETLYLKEEIEDSKKRNALIATDKPPSLEKICIPQDQSEALVPGARTKVYRPLMSRPTCESLETRVNHYVKRQRLDPDILQQMSSVDVAGESSPAQ